MKAIFIVLAAVLGIILIAGGIFYFSYFSSGPLATLVIDSGNAQYKSSGDWQNANNGMTLNQGDSVKTLDNSAAKIIFSDSVLRLDANTEIALDTLNKDTVSISQAIGKTWTNLLKISGIKSYEISTPDAIATVRGTVFSIEIGNGTRVAVINGTVHTSVNGTNGGGDITANKEATVHSGDSSINEIDLLIDSWIKNNIQLDVQHKAEIKARIEQKYSTLLNIAKSQQKISDEDMDKLIAEWIDGKYSIKEEIAKGTIPASLAMLIPPEFKRY